MPVGTWTGDGQPDVASEDRNGDELVNVEDCAGGSGSNGVPGFACWDLDEDGAPDLPAEDRNGDGAATVLDCDGASTGSLTGRVIDANTLAGLASVTVWTYPETTTVSSEASGAFEIADVPLGMYLVLARGTTVQGSPTDASAGPVSVVAVAGGAIDVRSSAFQRLGSRICPRITTPRRRRCSPTRTALSATRTDPARRLSTPT